MKAKGDLHIDHHHTTEDVGIALGQAVKQALGDMKGITRYADVHVPMDETLTRVAIDVSGPAVPGVQGRVRCATRSARSTPSWCSEWFQAFAMNAGITLHVETLYGTNDHHIAETCFKALARALRAAVAIDPRAGGRGAVDQGLARRLNAAKRISACLSIPCTNRRRRGTAHARSGTLRLRARRLFFLGVPVGAVWLLWRRLWLGLLLCAIVVVAVERRLRGSRLGTGARAAIAVRLALLLGLGGGDALGAGRSSAAAGSNVGVVVGDDLEAAERRFFRPGATRARPSDRAASLGDAAATHRDPRKAPAM